MQALKLGLIKTKTLKKIFNLKFKNFYLKL